jgi:hypothetical protein
MTSRTVPMPHKTEVEDARSNITAQAERAGLNTQDNRVRQFIDQQVTCTSQQAAEIRWLRGKIQDNVDLFAEVE